MNPSPLPTPYDIVEIPYFAYVPGILAWLAFLLFAALSVQLVKRLRRRKPKNHLRALDLAVEELQALTGVGSRPAKDSMAIASIVTKRFISIVEGRDLTAQSAQELRELQKGCQDKALAGLLERVIDLDTYRYQPSGAALPGREMIDQLIELLRTYYRTRINQEQ